MEDFSIIKTTFDQIKSYRTEYFHSLPEFQELFIELMVNKSSYFSLQIGGNDVGYAIINSEGVLTEFYVKSNFVPTSHVMFNSVLKEYSVTDIYCKTFDSLLLSNCMLNALTYSVVGPLYRDYTEAKMENDISIQMVKTGLSSKELFLKQDDSLKELYETEELLIEFLLNENVFAFFKNEELIGCGMIIKTILDWDFCDLGVWVNPKNRGYGFGAQILMKLREYALKSNLKPSCGCAIENVASQKTIEKSGFVSRYQLVNFKTR
jgi:predicted acetyltransferase